MTRPLETWFTNDMSTTTTCRLRVTPTAYRGAEGFGVTGTDHLDRRISIFVRHEATARAIVAAYKADGGQGVDKLIREEVA